MGKAWSSDCLLLYGGCSCIGCSYREVGLCSYLQLCYLIQRCSAADSLWQSQTVGKRTIQDSAGWGRAGQGRAGDGSALINC